MMPSAKSDKEELQAVLAELKAELRKMLDALKGGGPK
jgi:uncharacterized protein YukE